MKRIVDRFVRALLYVPMVALVAMICVEAGNIIGRPLKLPIQGSVELTGYLGAIFISICIFYTTRSRSNVAVKMLSSNLSDRAGAVLLAFNSFIGVGTIALLLWAAAKYAWKMMLEGESSLLLNINLPMIRFTFVLGLVLVGIVLAVNLYTAIVKAVRK